MHGAVTRDGMVNRKKTYKDNRGRVIGEGKQEAYYANPRDYEKHPITPAEQAHQSLWGEAGHRATEIFHADEPLQTSAFYSPEEAVTLRADYLRRYNAQTPYKRGSHPDPMAPFDPKSRKAKRYKQFPAFLRAMIFYDLKNQPSANQM